MKKTYFSPESKEIEIKIKSTILVGSDKGDGDPIMNDEENGDGEDGF